MFSLRGVRIAVSIAVALLFWLTVRLSARYSAVWQVPLGYDRLPKAYVLKTGGPASVTVEVRSTGTQQLLRSLQQSPDTLQLDLDALSAGGRLSREQLRLQLEQHLAAGVEVLSVRPDSLRLGLERRQLRAMPVAVNLQATPAPGFILLGPPQAYPDSVLVLATRGELNQVAAWPTEPWAAGQVAEALTVEVPVMQTPTATTEPSYVRVALVAERYTEGRFRVKLNAVNAAVGTTARLDPQQAEVVFLAPLSRFAQLNSSDFEVAVDVSAADPVSGLAPVVLTRLPTEVRRVRLRPSVVQVVQRLPYSGRLDIKH